MEDGFKKLPKMQCFREGGSVKTKGVKNAMCSGGKTYKKGGHAESEEMKKDIAQDKAIIKKAFKMHDEQEHKGEKTDLSKLRKGGRMKKSVGTVKKYKAGGEVVNVYEAKKKSGDKDAIKKVKQIKPTKAEAPSKAATLPVMEGTANVMKKGGKMKKYATGGSVLKDVDAEENPGLAKLPTEVRNKMGYAKKGGAAKKSVKKFADGSLTGELTAEEKNWLGGADPTDPFIMARMRSALGPRKPVPAPVAPTAIKPVDSTLRDETGMVSSLQRNPETGELYTPISQMTPAPVKKPVVRPARPVTRPVDSMNVLDTAFDETGKRSDLDRLREMKRESTRGVRAPLVKINPYDQAGYKKGGKVKKYEAGGNVTDEEKARMPAGKLPQQIVDEEATKENVETREMVAGPLRKLKKGLLETFKSKSQTPMRKGGKACK